MTDAERFELLLEGVIVRTVPFPGSRNTAVQITNVSCDVIGPVTMITYQAYLAPTIDRAKLYAIHGSGRGWPVAFVEGRKGKVHVLWRMSEFSVTGIRVMTNTGDYYHHWAPFTEALQPVVEGGVDSHQI